MDSHLLSDSIIQKLAQNEKEKEKIVQIRGTFKEFSANTNIENNDIFFLYLNV